MKPIPNGCSERAARAIGYRLQVEGRITTTWYASNARQYAKTVSALIERGATVRVASWFGSRWSEIALDH